MPNCYFKDDYIEDDYFERDLSMAITPLPDAPSRSQPPEIFVEAADAFLSALPQLAVEIENVSTALTANSTNALSADTHTIAASGSKAFTVQIGKSYVVGMTVRAAAASDGTTWMQGDVTAYNAVTGALTIVMNASSGSGSYSSWILSLSSATATGGSLAQDFSVKSLTHAVGSSIASASTINLSTATGNLVHITGNSPISAATMTAGKDVWAVIDGTPQFTYHATNLRLNSGGANITGAAGDIALFTYDGTTVRVAYFRASGKAIVETAPPAGAPVGSFLLYAGSTPPANYLTCPTTPTNLSRSTYNALYTAIGWTWGAGDGSTTFGMPWFAANYAMVQANSNVGSATVGEVIAHTHSLPFEPGTITYPVGGSETGKRVGTSTTGSTGGAANLAAGGRVLICVKYQ